MTEQEGRALSSASAEKVQRRARRRVESRITDAEWQARSYLCEPSVRSDPAALAFWKEQLRLWKRALAAVQRRAR